MQFPLFFLVISLAAGILLSSLFFISIPAAISALLISLASTWLFFLFRKNKSAFAFLLLTVLFLGSTLHTSRNRAFKDNPLHKFKSTAYSDFIGSLYKSPSRGNNRDFLFLKVEKVVFNNKEEKIKGNLRISIPLSSGTSSLRSLLVHDKIKVSAKITPLKDFQNFNPSSLKEYLKNQNIHNRAYSKSPLLVEKIKSGNKYSILRIISFLRLKFLQKIEEHFTYETEKSLSSQGAILEALLLGERGRIPDSISRTFQNSGLYHLFAISGAHIAIISFLFFSIFKIIKIPTRLSYILLIVFLIIYALLVEGRPSVIRATIMTLAFLFGKLIWKDVNLINTISMSAFFLLIINPFNLFALGFQLTFAATLSIILFLPKIIKYLPRFPLKISELFAISFTAQLGVLPFIARAFNRVAFSSLILNFAALPLIGVIMACGYIFLPLSFLSASLARIMVKVISYLISLLITTSHLFDSLAFISYRIPTPRLLTIICYFVFLFLLLLPSRIKKQKLIFSLCFIAAFVIIIIYPFKSNSKTLKFTFIDVGQGDSILVEFPGRKKMLIDGGGFPVGTFDIGERVVSPLLWRKGIRKIDYLILTHAHPDHLNGLKAVVRNFKIGEYWESVSPLQDKTYTSFKKSLSPLVILRKMFRNQILIENNVRIETLHPQEAKSDVLFANNDQSLVLRFVYGKTSFLLTGDIEIESENDILQTEQEISSQVMKSPHHGSNSSSSMAFLKKVSPAIVVISVGEGNWYGFPSSEVLKRYNEIGSKVLRTDINGAVEISSDGNHISIRTASSK
ncbi:MAG: DNA internalization-related competence protein ComEC/Rec2 [Acidobacteriota bacterium]|nr:DNA internalization-related competence protein ComEC/Rec2 [Acidobacteriota bacterium]